MKHKSNSSFSFYFFVRSLALARLFQFMPFFMTGLDTLMENLVS